MPKLISWNIAGRIKVRSEQLAWIKSEKADVLALQEVARESDLRQRLCDLGFNCFASTEPMDGRNKLGHSESRAVHSCLRLYVERIMNGGFKNLQGR
jgi:exonuclease III